MGLHTQDCFEIRRINLDIARVLRVEYRAIEHRRLVVAAVIMLQLCLYLALLEVLLQETCELRQFGVVGQLRYIDVREIEFICHHQRLLLMHARFRGDRTDEQVLRGYTTALTTLTTLTRLTRLTRLCLLILRQNFNPHTVGLHVLAIYFDGSGADRKGACCTRHEHVSVGLLKRRSAFAVNERSATAGTCVRTGQHIEIRELRCTQVPAALVNRISQLERSAYDHLFRCTRLKYHIIGKRRKGN